VAALDKFVDELSNTTGDKVAIRFPECPRCKQQIRRCTRYTPIVNRVHNLIAQVKRKILGNQSEQEMNERRQRLINDYERTQLKLSEINLDQMTMFFETLRDPDGLFSNDLLTLMENILLFLKEADKLMTDGRTKLPISTFEDLVSTSRHVRF
jgi:uncharacterized C2H2 Zn-finger protein